MPWDPKDPKVAPEIFGEAPFFTDLNLQIALISLKGMVSKATIAPPDVTPDW